MSELKRGKHIALIASVLISIIILCSIIANADCTRWVYYKDIPTESGGEGVTKRVLAYSDDVMVVENTFDTGAVGKLHHHPHTQITYVKSGRFLFTIDGEQHEVTEGDTLLKTNGVEHGCVCLKAGVLIDVFAPYREDFVKD